MKRVRANISGYADQRGLASIIIVATLAIILSLIALGSIRVSNRNLSSSLSTQVAKNADYAAESGINEIIKKLSSGSGAPLPPATFNSSGTFGPVPAGVTSVKVEAWGAGGGGGNSTSNLAGGDGGGGGEYAAEPSLAVTPGNSYTVTVGTGGTHNTTGVAANANSTFPGDSVTVTAHGGQNSNRSGTRAGGTGSTNSTHHNGGAGAGTNNSGGGGGEGGGKTANGGNAAGSTGGTGTEGGDGANGSGSGSAGSPGIQPGGAGSGGGVAIGGRVGGDGGKGQVVITYPSQQAISAQTNCTTGANAAITKPSLSIDTQITCALVDPNPSSLVYQNLGTGTGKLIKVQTTAAATSYMLSWSLHQNDPNNPVTVGFSSSGSTPNITELAWNKNAPNAPNPPLMQVTFYPVSTGGLLSAITPKTFYFYPYGGVAGPITPQPYSTATGSTLPINCKAKTVPGGYTYNDTGSYDCNAIISSLAPATANYYYMRIMPFYTNADFRVEANTASGLANFANGSQISIDVTAKSGVARKRLQARVTLNTTDTAGDNAFTGPDVALRSSNAICKRFVVSGTNDITLPSDDAPYCRGTSVSVTGPSASLAVTTGFPSSGYNGFSSSLTWTVTGPADHCTATGGTGGDTWTVGTKAVTGGSQAILPINGSPGIVNYYIQCFQNADGSGAGNIAQAQVTIKAVSHTFYASLNPVNYNTTNTLNWTTSAGAFDGCYAGAGGGDWGNGLPNPPTGGPPEIEYAPSGSQINIPGITLSKLYYITCTGNGTGGEYNGSLTWSTPINMNPPSVGLSPSYPPYSRSFQDQSGNFNIWYGAGGSYPTPPSPINQPIRNADSCASYPAQETNSRAAWDNYHNWLVSPKYGVVSMGWNFPPGTVLDIKESIRCVGDGGTKSTVASSLIHFNIPAVPPPPPPPGPPPPPPGPNPPPPSGGPPTMSLDIHIRWDSNGEYPEYHYPGFNDGNCADGGHYWTVCNVIVTADSGDPTYNALIQCRLLSNGQAKISFNNGNTGALSWDSSGFGNGTFGWDTFQNQTGADPQLTVQCNYSDGSYPGGGEARSWSYMCPWGYGEAICPGNGQAAPLEVDNPTTYNPSYGP